MMSDKKVCEKLGIKKNSLKQALLTITEYNKKLMEKAKKRGGKK